MRRGRWRRRVRAGPERLARTARIGLFPSIARGSAGTPEWQLSRTPQVLAALVAAFALAFLATAGVPAAAATTSQAKAKPAASKATAGKRAKASADSRSVRATPGRKVRG